MVLYPHRDNSFHSLDLNASYYHLARVRPHSSTTEGASTLSLHSKPNFRRGSTRPRHYGQLKANLALGGVRGGTECALVKGQARRRCTECSLQLACRRQADAPRKLRVSIPLYLFTVFSLVSDTPVCNLDGYLGSAPDHSPAPVYRRHSCLKFCYLSEHVVLDQSLD